MKYPLYKISRSKASGQALIIAMSQEEALARAKAVWEAKGLQPLSADENVNIATDGTVDYIPSMPTDHIEGK